MAGVLVALGVRMVRRSLGELVDEQDAGDYETVSRILDSHVEGAAGARAPLIRGWHKLRTRHIGRHHWVEFHIQVNARTDVRTAHDVASAIEHEIELALGCGETRCTRDADCPSTCGGCITWSGTCALFRPQ